MLRSGEGVCRVGRQLRSRWGPDCRREGCFCRPADAGMEAEGFGGALLSQHQCSSTSEQGQPCCRRCAHKCFSPELLCCLRGSQVACTTVTQLPTSLVCVFAPPNRCRRRGHPRVVCLQVCGGGAARVDRPGGGGHQQQRQQLSGSPPAPGLPAGTPPLSLRCLCSTVLDSLLFSGPTPCPPSRTAIPCPLLALSLSVILPRTAMPAWLPIPPS